MVVRSAGGERTDPDGRLLRRPVHQCAGARRAAHRDPRPEVRRDRQAARTSSSSERWGTTRPSASPCISSSTRRRHDRPGRASRSPAVGPKNIKAVEAEQALVGQSPSDELFAEAAELAARAADPRTDVRGSAEYKRAVVRTFVRRGLARPSTSPDAREEQPSEHHRHGQRHRADAATSNRGYCSPTSSAPTWSSPARTSAATPAAAACARSFSTARR